MKKVIKNGSTRYFYEKGDKVTKVSTGEVFTVEAVDTKAKTIKTIEGVELPLTIDIRGCRDNNTKVVDLKRRISNIKIKYFDKDMPKLEKLIIGDWIDLRSVEDIELKKGEFALIPLGIATELPRGFEAHVVPRGSTFKNFRVIQTNGMGIIDESYNGDNDQWFMPVYAVEDTKINKYDRICQFRIQRKMPKVIFTEVEKLENEDRNGHGSTGIK